MANGLLQRINSTPSISCYVLVMETETKKKEPENRKSGEGGRLLLVVMGIV